MEETILLKNLIKTKEVLKEIKKLDTETGIIIDVDAIEKTIDIIEKQLNYLM